MDSSSHDEERKKTSIAAHKLGGATLNTGLEASIKSMRKGERSRFLVPSKNAFGTDGLPPLVPPNADVEYEIELLNFTSVSDLSQERDGSLIKRNLMCWRSDGERDGSLIKRNHMYI